LNQRLPSALLAAFLPRRRALVVACKADIYPAHSREGVIRAAALFKNGGMWMDINA
jgi:hypothetical protein